MTFVQGRINAQFIIEGVVAAVMAAVDAFGWIVVNYANQGLFFFYLMPTVYVQTSTLT